MIGPQRCFVSTCNTKLYFPGETPAGKRGYGRYIDTVYVGEQWVYNCRKHDDYFALLAGLMVSKG